MPAIHGLVSYVDGDPHELNASEFLVAEDTGGAIIGCGRLRSYPEFRKMASLVADQSVRTHGLDQALVAGLPDMDLGKIYLVCEDRLVEFFQSFDFSLFPAEDMPDGLRPKWQYYCSDVGLMNVMVRS